MRICKVKIIKNFNAGICNNIYPSGYDPHKINVIAYDEKPLSNGNNVGYCIGIVNDDFSFTKDMVEIDKITANDFIDDRASIYEDANQKKFKDSRKGVIIREGIE